MTITDHTRAHRGPRQRRASQDPARRTLPMPAWLILAAFAAILHLTYATLIAPTFGYLGSRYRSPDVLFYAIAFALVLVVHRFMPRHLGRPSDLILWMLFTMNIVPVCLVPQYAAITTPSMSLWIACAAAASFSLVLWLTRGPTADWVPLIPLRAGTLWTTCAVASLACTWYIYYISGFSQIALGFEQLRSTRMDYRDQVAASGALLGYVVRLSGNVLNPMLIGRGIARRRPSMIAIGLLGQAIAFSATGFKMILLSTLAIIVLPLLFRATKPRGVTIVASIAATSALSLIIDRAAQTLYLTEVFIDRLLLIPGTLTAAHVLIFDDQAKAKWGYSFLKGFVDYPYSVSPSRLVGERFIGSAETNANANYIADGFANLGFWGVFIEAVVLALVLRAIDSAARQIPLKAAAPALLVPTLSLANSSVFTSVLTGGFAAIVVAFAFWPRDDDASACADALAESNTSAAHQADAAARTSEKLSGSPASGTGRVPVTLTR